MLLVIVNLLIKESFNLSKHAFAVLIWTILCLSMKSGKPVKVHLILSFQLMIIHTCTMCLAGSSQHPMALGRTLFDNASSKLIVSLSCPMSFLVKILTGLLPVQVKPLMIYWKFCKKFDWMILSQHPWVLMMQILIKLPRSNWNGCSWCSWQRQCWWC